MFALSNCRTTRHRSRWSLAAIAFVDIVGYTILMAKEEMRTHQCWMRKLSEVISPKAKKSRGP